MINFLDFALDNDVPGFSENAVTLSSGRESYYYINWRKVGEDPKKLESLADFVIDFSIEKIGNFSGFVGVPEGATKLGIITHYRWASGYGPDECFCFPMFRAVPKKHGKPEDRYFLGKIPNGVIVIEDVTTTAESLVERCMQLREANVKNVRAICLTDRSAGEAYERLSSLDVPFYPLTTAQELVPLAYQKLRPGKKIGRLVESEFEKQGFGKIKLVDNFLKIK